MNKKLKITLIVIISVLAFYGLSYVISLKLPEEPKKEEKVLSVTDWYNDTLTDEYIVTVVGSSTCPHCNEYQPVIEEIADEYGFKLYFFKTDKLSEEDYNKLVNAYQFTNEYIPYTVIIKNGKVIAGVEGFESKDSTIKYLKEHKVIEN